MIRVSLSFIIIIFFNFALSAQLHIGYYKKGLWLTKNKESGDLVFKDGLQDGQYIIFSKKWAQGDTILVAHFKNGELNGPFYRWDDKKHYLIDECLYKDGLICGIRKMYYRDKNNVLFTNIFLYENGELKETIQNEW